MTTATTTPQPVPAHSLEVALEYVRKGGTLLVPTQTRCTIITKKNLASWEKAGLWLLREDGEGYRLRAGKGSVYLLPGQLRYA